MQSEIPQLFSTTPDSASSQRAHLAALQVLSLSPTPDQLAIHYALATHTLTPDEATIRRAADWLNTLFIASGCHGDAGCHGSAQFADPCNVSPMSATSSHHQILTTLAEKSALILRLAHRHAPTLTSELESPTSPLHPIESASRFLPPPPTDPAPLAILRQSLAALILPDLPPPGTDPTWHDNRRRLRHLILHDNPYRFLTWPVIQNSMFMNDPTIAAPELAALQSQPEFQTRWLPALQEDPIGAPARTPLHPTSSNNLIHHAFNLLQLFGYHAEPGCHESAQFADLCNVAPNNTCRLESLQTILEFGGGYGSTARLAHRLGFRGNYIIFDLPEFSALQRFYLTSLSLPVAPTQPSALRTQHSNPIHLISSLDSLYQLLPTASPDLFLATWSLSETPSDFRLPFVPFLRNSKNLLIAYQSTFANVDNTAYFANLQLPHCNIRNYAIPHLPQNHYLTASA